MLGHIVLLSIQFRLFHLLIELTSFLQKISSLHNLLTLTISFYYYNYFYIYIDFLISLYTIDQSAAFNFYNTFFFSTLLTDATLKIIMLNPRNWIFIYFTLFVSIILYGQDQTNFKHISLTFDGKQYIASRSLQDEQGCIWFSYAQGILKYDGYEFQDIPLKRIFKSETQDYLKNIVKDSKGNIWLLSKNGKVSKYAANGKFTLFTIESEVKIDQIFGVGDKMFFASNFGDIYLYSNKTFKKIFTLPANDGNYRSVYSMALSKSNKLYIGTNRGSVFTFSLKNNYLKELEGDFKNYPSSIVLALDHNENLWIGTETLGLYAYNTLNHKFFQNELYKNSPFNLTNELFITLMCDNKGMIWAGTDGSGLYQINPDTFQIKSYKSIPTNPYSLSSNSIIDIHEDLNNNLWILSNYGDVNILPNRSESLHYHSGSDDNTPQRILSIYIAKNNDTWLGTDGKGLTRIKTKVNGGSKVIVYFKKQGFYVQSIAEDSVGNIWIGTYKNGLWILDHKSQRFEKLPMINHGNRNTNDVRLVFNDSKNKIWVCTSIFTNVYSSDKKILASFQNNKNELTGSIVESIVEDNNGSIWIGYYPGGLFELKEDLNNFKNSKFKKHNFFQVEEKSIHSDDVRDMTFVNDIIWIVNSDGNLFKFNTLEKIPQLYKKKKSFKDKKIVAVNSDIQNNIWLSSTYGIVYFNPKDSLIKNYYETDGLQSNYFLSRSSFRDKKGTLYFGNSEGINYFNPLEIKKSKSKAKLFISSIEILNQPADSIIPKQLEQGITNVKQLNLDYDQSSFSFKFIALDNILSPNYHYTYKLKYFDDNWIMSHHNRVATYTNIPPGDYVFEVKAGDKIGEWNIPSKSISITISKPWWQHWIAYIIYFSLLIALAIWANRWIILRNDLIREKLNHKKENEMHDLKLDFYTKMSHEIQTPLTLIGGPIEDMLLKAKQNENLLLYQRLKIISNNVKRLSKIVFELTTVRNKDLGRLKLLVKKNNLCEEINNISLSFKEEARIKKIDFTSNCPQNLREAWYDKDKIEHIIFNLLSNAFKFTPKNGNIQLNIIPIKSKDKVKISITDSGPGIPSKDLENIFTIFYQTDLGKKLHGTGIGLTLTKELVDLHRGKIEVTSSNEEGTCFTITLPIAEKNYHDSEKIMTDEPDEELNRANLEGSHSDDIEIPTDKSKKTILVVEDNFELQIFLKDLLMDHYNIILANNGEEGLNYAKSNMPDLILSDIMMPIMDGVKMCNLLQKNALTNHIPVILITAKNSSDSKIQGLKSGAIEYIHKPFNTKELQLKIKNIISSKQHLLAKIKNEMIHKPHMEDQKTQDEVFLENLVYEINLRIENTDFKIGDLAYSLHMSHSTLYRKCQIMTGMSLVDFVRDLRLKKAAIFIAKFGYTISETAFKVGFNDPKYLSKCFKKKFGKSPRLFRIEAKRMGVKDYLKSYSLE